MSWKDIEMKWAAMARRVRSDLCQDNDDAVGPGASKPPSVPKDVPDRGLPSPLDRPAA